MPENDSQSAERTFPTTRSDRDLVPSLEDPSVLRDGVMHLGLEHFEETRFTDLLPCLWPSNQGLVGMT